VDVLQPPLAAKRSDSLPQLTQRLAVTRCHIPKVCAPAINIIA